MRRNTIPIVKKYMAIKQKQDNIVVRDYSLQPKEEVC